MLAEQTSDPPLEDLEPVTNATGIVEVIDEATRIFVEESLHRYVVEIVRQTRDDPRLYLGASPRAGIALLRVAKARALGDERLYLGASPRAGIALLRVAKARAISEGREYVLPDDVKAVAVPVLGHRLILGPEARANGTKPAQLVREAVERTPVPA